MKKIIKSIIGDILYFRILDLIIKFSPQKRRKEKEENDNRKTFFSSILNKNDLCFDVGANMGNRIKPLLEMGARVVAVEPQESCQKYLNYKYGNKIEIVKKGLADSDGSKTLYIANSTVLSSFSEEWIESFKEGRFSKYSWNKKVQVEMTTLDKLILKYGKPNFIKIDVEGYELNVLKGLSSPINLICFEYAVPEQTKNVIACINQLLKISTNLSFNYCIGENMNFVLPNWIGLNEMQNLINSQEFIDSAFGDVYVRMQ